MKKELTCLYALLLACFSTTMAIAQTPDYAGTKEKMYLHTDHVFYRPGDPLFFKLYLVRAASQMPSYTSGVAYVEVINPAGNVLQKLSYKITDGYAEGSYDLDAGAVGGVYKLRAYTYWMQNEQDSTWFTKEITVQQIVAPRVLMKLDFPKKGYGAGEEVLADYSIRNLADQPIRNHEAAYTVSIGGKEVQTSRFTTNDEGKAQVKFRLPQSLTTTDGLLNITVQYDSYTEAISRSIPIVLNKIDLQWMPEGGAMVVGLPTQLAFRAVNEWGKPADVKGVIKDEKGQTVAHFESYRFGMGKLPFTPQPGRRYTAFITAPASIAQTYNLPTATANGLVMNMASASGKLQITLAASAPVEVTLTGETKNVRYFSRKMLLQKGAQTIELNPAGFPVGIARFTALLGDGLPVAERLVFLNEDKGLQVKLTMDKEKYGPREKVTMHLRTTGFDGQPIASNLSLSVVDDKLWTMADDRQDNILSWLLLSSELRGKVEEPSFYFKKDEPQATPALDLVMLTHGYRYFDFTDYVKQNGHLPFTPEQETIISGMVRNNKQQPVKAAVYLVSRTGSGEAVVVQTGADGVFCFSGMKPATAYQVIARSQQPGEDITVQVTGNGNGYNPMKAKQIPLLATRKNAGLMWNEIQAIGGPVEKEEAFLKQDMPVLLNAVNANLNDVVVIGFGTQRRQNVIGSVATVAARQLDNEMDINNALAGRVAGLQVVQMGNPGLAPQIRIRGVASLTGAAEPLLVVDGVPVNKARLNAINPADIESVSVLKDATATAVFGSQAANGVILVNSKKNARDKLSVNLSKNYHWASTYVQASGTAYSVARRFYAPVYTTTQTEDRTDFRETIYWNPVVQTDKNGEATVEFYNSDATTTFRAIAECIGYNGKVGRAEATYAVQSAMSMDVKIPPYLTIGDKALLPLVLRNNRNESLPFAISLQLPAGMQAGAYEQNITLAANASQQVLLPVWATTALQDTVRISVSNSYGKEKLVLPISAAEKGFPVVETFAGNTNASHPFTISKMIPGSLHTNLKLYTSVEGQLTDGIESMLQEPHGCFEQTSSSTYPNLFVLKYLRESGRSNPAIEKKAMDYIQAGYQRLIGFETSQNGFEWFGHAPAHEALTAYGLLEFTDMQEFIAVDKAMLARTKAFLLSRRDGKGGFTIASGGYDRFASVPNHIANIYIVYALTQAGVGNEILPEYTAAVQKAISSGDGYQMAMMALAASNLKKEEDYNRLMGLLQTLYQQKNLASETSVVNSRDASLRVEALSLYALALARTKQPSVGIIATLISKIMAEKNYYGYGSTQATVLALNAVVAYSKIAGRIAADAPVKFTANGQSITTDNAAAPLQEGTNLFAVQYANPQQAVPYSYEVAYHTFTPPNSPKTELQLQTTLAKSSAQVGETVRMQITAKNTTAGLQPMAVAKIGIPAGLSIQPWQLKELTEKKQIAYYEIFDNYLVLYWMGFASNEIKTLALDLKAEIGGTYQGKASNVYLYYTPEYKHWNEGLILEVKAP